MNKLLAVKLLLSTNRVLIKGNADAIHILLQQFKRILKLFLIQAKNALAVAAKFICVVIFTALLGQKNTTNAISLFAVNLVNCKDKLNTLVFSSKFVGAICAPLRISRQIT